MKDFFNTEDAKEFTEVTEKVLNLKFNFQIQ